MMRADTPTTVEPERVDTSARPDIEAHSVRSRHRRVKPRTGTPPNRPYVSNAAAAASRTARSERARFTAFTTPRSDAVTIEEWMPTPQTT